MLKKQGSKKISEKAIRDINKEQVFLSIHAYSAVFLNRRAAAQYWALASIIPGREKP